MSKIIVVKYALTAGLFEIEAEILDNGYAAQLPRGNQGHFLAKKDYALTDAEAFHKAELLLAKKLEAIAKQKSKLRNKEFSIKRI